MLMYATALTPLIKSLEDAEFMQNWYADDSACVGTLSSLRMWFEKLCQLWPSYGYYPELMKTVIVVDKKDEESANACFHNSGKKIVNGYHFLGGFIGSKELTKQYIYNEDKIDAWLVCVDKLAWAVEL